MLHHISLDKYFCASFLCARSSTHLSIIFSAFNDLNFVQEHSDVELFQLAIWSVSKAGTEATVLL